MHKLNITGLAVIVAVLISPTAANAASWVCEHSNLVREITVERTTPAPAPCAVAYNKSAEGLGTSEPWTAQSDGAYCDAKADFLAEKLTGLGWSCTAF